VTLDIPVRGSHNEADKCTRWYFLFDDSECSNPGPIDYMVYTLEAISGRHKTVNGKLHIFTFNHRLTRGHILTLQPYTYTSEHMHFTIYTTEKKI